MPKILAIYREITNSPNHEQDDTLILRAVAEELSKLGAETALLEPEKIGSVNPAEWDAVIPMCENPPALKTIAGWKGPHIVNPVEAVLNCYRVNMTPLMSACGEIHPKTEIIPTEALGAGKPVSCFGPKGAWVKRGDVHNTCDHDVVYIGNWADAMAVRRDFEPRGITSVVVQEHIDGDLVKFYAVGPLKWFGWFYHSDPANRTHSFDLEKLENHAAQVARAVGLEVYGGDAIITPQGRIYVIDINSWPSFARVRDEVKTPIAQHIYAKVSGKHAGRRAVKGAVL
ncbi:MAG: hypothetical protein PHW69_05555 [Elusimicrobiaceae bacterium]|nr:hypothetical protein [Elusimicrobiaceae bacterium]